MKKASLYLLTILLSALAFGQTETFDIIHYTPPKDFKEDRKPGVVTYTYSNTGTGVFCIIAIYASRAGAGDEQKDFANEWNDLVVTPYKVTSNPKTETQTNADGWKAVAAAASVKLDGNSFYVLLTVFSGFGKKVSVLANLNDQSYASRIDTLFQNMKLDKITSTTNSNSNSNEQPGKFLSMSYTTPAGWKEQQFPDGVVFTPTNLPAGEHLFIQILPPLNFSGVMEDGFKQSYDEACTRLQATKMYMPGSGDYSKKQSGTSFKGWEYILGSGAIQVDNGKGSKDEYGLDLFVIKINNRFERIAIAKSRNHCGLSTYYPSDRLKYADDIERFLFSLQFADWKEPLLKTGSIQGDGIIGLWLGISYDPATLLNGTFHQDVFCPIFLSNGRAYFGPQFPSEGLYEFNGWIPGEQQPRYWGAYSFDNGKGVLKMPYGDIPLRMENNQLIARPNNSDNVFSKLNSVDGARFNGTYALSAVNGNIPLISFTSGGQFTDNGALKLLYHEYTDCINEALIPGSGTYEVKDHSVIFSYADGRKIKIAFIGSGYDKNNPAPATLTLSFHEDVLKRQ